MMFFGFHMKILKFDKLERGNHQGKPCFVLQARSFERNVKHTKESINEILRKIRSKNSEATNNFPRPPHILRVANEDRF